MHLIILINQGAGTRSKKQFLREIAWQCSEKQCSYEVHSSWYINKHANVKRISLLKNACIVICGGDGTVNKVIKAFWEQNLLNKVMFAIYPGGTFNALIKNLNYSGQSLARITESIEKKTIIKTDLLEIELSSDKKTRRELAHCGILFVKDCGFTKHAAEIQKALHQFDVKLGFKSLKKSLPYLSRVPEFLYLKNKKEEKLQGIFISNNPYLISMNKIHAEIRIDDNKLDIFKLATTDYFQLGKIASVILLGARINLEFVEHSQAKSFSFQAQEDLDMNLDGDIERIERGTEIKIKVSPQKLKLINYL